MDRIVVVGTSGSGKTTLAKQIASCLKMPHIELDSLHWDANWTEAPDFVQRVDRATASDRWVIDGNYRKASHLSWARARHIIWLDYPLRINLWRITHRTLRRAITKKELWNGNRESLRNFFFSDDSMFRWVLETHSQRRRDYSTYIAENAYPHLEWVRLQSPRETQDWLDKLCASP